jgi:hypothetical protein
LSDALTGFLGAPGPDTYLKWNGSYFEWSS